MYLLIIIVPLLSAIIAGLAGRYLGAKGSGWITSTLIVITCCMSWLAFYEVGICGSVTYIQLWNWIEVGVFQVTIGMIFDSVTVTMLIVVTTVSSLVHIYSTGYMAGDPHVPRFMSYLSLFTFFMLILVTADNILQLFIGWEGVGLCSYLLINFWFTRIQANKSAMKAMIVNRIGDVGIALAMFIIYDTFKTLEFSSIFALTPILAGTQDNLIIWGPLEFDRFTIIGLLLLIGAAGKSAQLGLHTWLPDTKFIVSCLNVSLVRIISLNARKT